MAGYRRVNYYELCRLCTSSEGTKMHIFREEGRRRSLPSKIQKCLPLQVQEEDSLPKIICSACVDKLESYYEFRESCINAEAMLESYFTSLKYSEDVAREGKVSVYVKDEPPKKKEDIASSKVKGSNVANINSTTNLNETNSVQQPSAIQILTDPDGNRLTQYKVQVQGGIPSLVPVRNPGGLPLSVSISTLTPQHVKQQTTSTTTAVTTTTTTNRSTEGGSQATDAAGAAAATTTTATSPLVTAVAIAPQSQDLMQQLAVTSKDRGMVTELLKLKNINVVDQASFESMTTLGSSQVQGSAINTQVPSLLPASIRLDQLNQLISSNLQINMNQQSGQEEAVLQAQPQTQQQAQQQQQQQQQQGKTSVNRGVTHLSQNAVKPGRQGKLREDVAAQEEKVSPTNGSEDRVNNTLAAKANISITDIDKGGEGDLKYDGDDLGHHLDEDEMDDGTEGHQQTSEGDENVSYECEFCSKLFKRKEHLFQHRKSHSGERPFVCATCEKAFSRKEHLLRHNVCHTGQKQYMCDVCRKSFSRKDNLHKHRKTHGINGPHVCETCGKSFVVKHYYIMHKAQHESVPNTENSTGATIKYLTSTNSTTNPLPFKCDLCTKSFSMKQYLTSHRMRHRNKVKKESGEGEESSEQQQQQQQQGDGGGGGGGVGAVAVSTDVTTVSQPAILTSFPAAGAAGTAASTTATGNLNLSTINTQLTTINPSALLAPNIIHHSSANVVHIGNNSYLCTPNVTQELLDQYRKLHAS